MRGKIQFTQSDVRRGATLLATYHKGVRLNRPGEIVRPLYVKWVDFRNQFVHEHALEEETNLYIASHPEIMRSISIPK